MKLFIRLIICLVVALVSAVSVSAATQPVRPLDRKAYTSGLDGRNIALWQSHGLYYNIEKGEWLWQRAHLMQTIEDLYSASYVIDLLVPMLENAGAYVMLPRERDLNRVEVIIDADSPSSPGYSELSGTSRWSDAPVAGFRKPSGALTDRRNPFAEGGVRMVSTVTSASQASSAAWSASIPHEGVYTVYISYASLPESSREVVYTVNSLRGEERFAVDQAMGGGTWIRLGEFPFAAGKPDKPLVTLTNLGADPKSVVTADAVRIGGGIGNVARSGPEGNPTVSGKSRWMEGARYYMQWAGVPDSVYSPTEYVNDYTDDFSGRPRWVNYLAGGSSRVPGQPGLGIPIDLAFALHTDAGTTPDSTIVGTLGIYSTDSGSRLGDGRRRTTSRDLTESIVNSVINDIRALHEPGWTKRKTRDRRYAEARIPLVPSALVELLSHQNYADMRYGLDPQFRFDAARAIYKGILRYLYSGSRKAYVVQPLAVSSFAIMERGGGVYRLSWRPTTDPIEPTAIPACYIIEMRDSSGAFRPIAQTTSTSYDYTAPEGQLLSFRVIAVNEGGRSFPSEALSLCRYDNRNPHVLIVNGFTRISAPESFDADSVAGFLDEIDYGVPYIRNIAYSGSQYDFVRDHPWVDDVVDPGFGASHSDFDGHPVSGNSFDYPSVHGRAVADARYSFVSASLQGYLDNLKHYPQPIIDLILGKQREIQPGFEYGKTRFKAFTLPLQQALEAHVVTGGSLLVSGEFIASDIFANPFSSEEVIAADCRFARDVLGIDHESSFAAVAGFVDVLPFWANDFTSSSTAYSSKPGEEIYVVGSPDAIIASDPDRSATIMTYSENGRSAAVASRLGESGVVAMGFPFEAIRSAADRSMLMRQLLNYLTTVKRPMAPRFEQMRPLDPAEVVGTPSDNHSLEISQRHAHR